MGSNDRRPFGVMPDGAAVERLTLKNGPLSCDVITYGGALQSLVVPDRAGRPTDVLLGFDTLEDYLRHDKFLGAIIGRYANRIGGASFPLGGKVWPLRANDGANHLHGGPQGFDKKVWRAESLAENAVTLSLRSPDGEEGYPGNLTVQVTYTLTGDALEIGFRAECDADTLCSLTNHAYFNLSGHQSGTVEDQIIRLFPASYAPIGAGNIPTGEIAGVEGTPMDLRRGLPIGRRIDEDFAQLKLAGGYDHTWVLDGPDGELKPTAQAMSPRTGIVMDVLTTLPGVLFYSGNYLDGCPAGKGGAPYAKRWGFCLETQYFPDSPHHPAFPSAVLRKGERYDHKTVFRFSTAP